MCLGKTFWETTWKVQGYSLFGQTCVGQKIIIVSKLHLDECNRKWKLIAMTWWANIAVMTLPIKKRINAELLTDRNNGPYIQKGEKETDQWKYLTSWKRVNWNGAKSKVGMETKSACLEWLTFHGRKDKLTAACLKRQSLKKWKIL